MRNNDDNFEFEYIDSSDESQNNAFEDVFSDTHIEKQMSDDDFIMFSDFSDRPSFRKKKHGIAGFFQNIGYHISDWWKRLKKWKKITLVSVVSILLVVTVAAVYIFSAFDYNYKDITKDPTDLGFDDVINDEVVNIALFGIDTRDTKSFSGNSDSIMILSINTKTKKVNIVSVLRDTLVPIEQNGKTTYFKINAAYGWGGPELAIKTLNKCFNLDISEYATVNFYGMVDIIDAVGGIDITLTEDEVVTHGVGHPGFNDGIDEICDNLGRSKEAPSLYAKKAGLQHVNGIQAVAYSRIRYATNIWGTTNDYGRTDRQRYVMEQLFNKAVQLDKKQYVKLAKALIPCSETSLSYSQIMSLAVNVLLKSPTFTQARVPSDGFQMPSPSGSFGSVVYYDLDYAAKVIHGIFYDNMTLEEYVAANPIEHNDWYAKLGFSSSTVKKPSTAQPTPTPSQPSQSSVASSEPPQSSESSSSQADSGDESKESSSTPTTEPEPTPTPEPSPTNPDDTTP